MIYEPESALLSFANSTTGELKFEIVDDPSSVKIIRSEGKDQITITLDAGNRFSFILDNSAPLILSWEEGNELKHSAPLNGWKGDKQDDGSYVFIYPTPSESPLIKITIDTSADEIGIVIVGTIDVPLSAKK